MGLAVTPRRAGRVHFGACQATAFFIVPWGQPIIIELQYTSPSGTRYAPLLVDAEHAALSLPDTPNASMAYVPCFGLTTQRKGDVYRKQLVL